MALPFFDSHLHIIDPAFPLIRNQGYLPDPFTAADYRAAVKPLLKTAGLESAGGSIVSGSFQGLDAEYIFAARQVLGPGFVAVVNLPTELTGAELDRLQENGIRGARFNLFRGSPELLGRIVDQSRYVYERFGWSIELYVDGGRLPELDSTLGKLPPFSIDHLGLTELGKEFVLQWLAKGARLKATGFSRLDFDPAPFISEVYSRFPKALMVGSDLPSTRAPRLFSGDDIKLIQSAVPESGHHDVFADNARRWYGLL